MDKDAENYEPDAEMPCSCCVFYGRAYLSYDYNFVDNLKSRGINSYVIYVNGAFYKKTKNSLSSTNLLTPAEKTFHDYNGIDAGNDNVINWSLGDQKQQLINVIIKGPGGESIWQGSVQLKANRVVFVNL